jgi:hypothetical protein
MGSVACFGVSANRAVLEGVRLQPIGSGACEVPSRRTEPSSEGSKVACEVPLIARRLGGPSRLQRVRLVSADRAVFRGFDWVLARPFSSALVVSANRAVFRGFDFAACSCRSRARRCLGEPSRFQRVRRRGVRGDRWHVSADRAVFRGFVFRGFDEEADEEG